MKIGKRGRFEDNTAVVDGLLPVPMGDAWVEAAFESEDVSPIRGRFIGEASGSFAKKLVIFCELLLDRLPLCGVFRTPWPAMTCFRVDASTAVRTRSRPEGIERRVARAETLVLLNVGREGALWERVWTRVFFPSFVEMPKMLGP